MSTRFRTALKRLVLLIASIIIALGLLEIGVRFSRPAFDPSGHLRLSHPIPDRPRLGPANTTQRHVKNTGDFDVTVGFNRHGFRDKQDIQTAKLADYIVVGDSFAFGWGVEEDERFSNIASDLLGANIFNIAMPNTSLAAYRELLDYSSAMHLECSNIIVSICMGNDLAMYPTATERDLHSANLPPRMKKSLRSWIRSNSAAYFLIAHTAHTSPWLRKMGIRLGLITPLHDGMYLQDYSPEVIKSSARRLQETISGYQATVLIIPSRALWAGKDQDIAKEVHEAFISALVVAGIPVIDLRGPMEETGNPLDHHFPNDGHWNAKGHALAARVLAADLSARTP